MSDREALRRRLYAPGADDRDVAAYAGTVRTRLRRPRRPRVRRPRGLALALAAVALVVVAIAAALLLPRPPAVPEAEAVPLTVEDRAELRTNLETVGSAGIAAYLVTHPSPPQLRGGTGFVTQELHGIGSGERRIDPTGAAASGRATVLLVTAVGGRATWTVRTAAGRAGPSRTQDRPPGTLTATTIRYAGGGRPSVLRVRVDDGVRWGASVVFSR